MKRLILVAILVLGFVIVSRPSLTHANILFPDCKDDAANSAVCKDADKPQTSTSNSFYGKGGILTKIVGLYAFGIGIVSVIMIIVSGFKLVTASGDPNNIKSARNTITFAIVGLVTAALATAIIRVVLNKL